MMRLMWLTPLLMELISYRLVSVYMEETKHHDGVRLDTRLCLSLTGILADQVYALKLIRFTVWFSKPIDNHRF